MKIKNLLHFLVIFLVAFGATFSSGPSFAEVEDYSCMNFKIINEEGTWSLFEGAETTKAVVTWSIIDPGNCITKGISGIQRSGIYWVGRVSSLSGFWDGNWSSARNGENYAIVFDFDIPNTWLKAVGNSPGIYDYGMPVNCSVGCAYARFSIGHVIERKVSTSQRKNELINASIHAGELWRLILSSRQGLLRQDCIPVSKKSRTPDRLPVTTSLKVLSAGQKSKIEIELSEPSNCLHLIYTPPIENILIDKKVNAPFWGNASSSYWENLTSPRPTLIRVSSNTFGNLTTDTLSGESVFSATRNPNLISSEDSVELRGSKVVITSTLSLGAIDKNKIPIDETAQILIGTYFRYNQILSCTSGGWYVNWTSNSSFRVTYSKGGCTHDGLTEAYQVSSITVPILDLFEVDGNLKAKQSAAEAKAAEARAAEARAAEAKAAEAKAAEAKAAEAKAAEAAVERTAADKVAAAKKPTTITCIKGKLTKKVTAVKPKCPSGYKKK